MKKVQLKKQKIMSFFKLFKKISAGQTILVVFDLDEMMTNCGGFSLPLCLIHL